MAERIVSPGVFTREKDLSFLPQGIAEIGAALIGPTKKGPAFVPTVIRNFQEFEEMFGSLDDRFYVPITAREYLRSAGTVTIVRVLGIGGYSSNVVQISADKPGLTDKQLYLVLAPNALTEGELTPLAGTETSGTFSAWNINSGSNDEYVFSASFDASSNKYYKDVFSDSPISTKAQGKDCPFYIYKQFPVGAAAHTSGGAIVSGSVVPLNLLQDYKKAVTPSVLSQKQDGNAENLFQVALRHDGETETNKHFKVAISNVKQASEVPGSDYGTFSLQVRKIDQQTFAAADDEIVEQFDNLNLDPKSTNFLCRRVGTRWISVDSDGKVNYNGDAEWPNLSRYVFITGSATLNEGGFAKSLVPYGHAAMKLPMSCSVDDNATAVFAQHVNNTFTTSQVSSTTSQYDTSIFYGFDFSTEDNRSFLMPLATDAAVYHNPSFSLDDMVGDAKATSALFGGATTFASASTAVSLAHSNVAQRKFFVPLQGGFDGVNPAIKKNTGKNITAANQQGLDCSSSTSSGSVAYERAIKAISNADEFDINLLATPGLIYNLHPSPVNLAQQTVQDRGDTFYVFDSVAWGDGINTAVNAITSVDTNYAATYYPWVKLLDDTVNLPIWVPPSVVIPGVIAQNDRVAHEWFAPAGLNRGGLRGVLEAKTRLTHAERDLLYENRINPIASFPGQGVVVFGQKTLQSKPSALDRINVRRLLIRLKKFIASSSRYLLFENNTVATRARFLNIVNPYLDSVQSNQGLTGFRVVMDDSNNTPDVIDRNQLVGQIFIQPARSVEFIVLDFVVQPSGATFQ